MFLQIDDLGGVLSSLVLVSITVITYSKAAVYLNEVETLFPLLLVLEIWGGGGGSLMLRDFFSLV